MEKLYKEMDFEDAEKYLATGLVRVESEDGVCGEITFMESTCMVRFKQHTISRCAVMFEFEIPSLDKLYASSTPFCRKLVVIRSNDTQNNSTWFCSLGNELKLSGIVILSDQKADWKKIRSLLDSNGKANVVIKSADNLNKDLEAIG